MIVKDGWRTGEYDESLRGNFIVEAYPVEGGPIILAEYYSDAGEWRLFNYHGAPFTREDESAIIRDIAEQQRKQSGWS